MTFAKGASFKDPSGLFNSSLEGNVRRAIDIHEGDKIDEAALKDLIRAAVALNLEGKNKAKPRRASSKRASSSSQVLLTMDNAFHDANGKPGFTSPMRSGPMGGRARGASWSGLFTLEV